MVDIWPLVALVRRGQFRVASSPARDAPLLRFNRDAWRNADRVFLANTQPDRVFLANTQPDRVFLANTQQ